MTDKLKDLESEYWQEIISYFEAMPKKDRPVCYRKYSTARELIALSQVSTSLTQQAASVQAPPKPRSLTDDQSKEAIHAGIAKYQAKRGNKASAIQDTLQALEEQQIKVPGKSPPSTLAALISRDSKKRYTKVSDGFWRLEDRYYQEKLKEYQGGDGSPENWTGAPSLESSAPAPANHHH